MLPRRPAAWAALILPLVLFAALAGPAAAQVREPTVPFSVTLAQWSRSFGEVERYLRSADQTEERTVRYADRMAEIRAEAGAVLAEARREIGATEPLLAALGEEATPDQGTAVPESGSVSRRRQDLQQRLTVLQSRSALAELTVARAAQLEAELSEQYRSAFLDRLQRPWPMPLAPSTVTAAVPEFLAQMGRIAASPVVWYDGLPPELRTAEALLPPLVPLLVAAVLALLVRGFLLRRFGQGSEIAHPTYARRLLAAVAETVARGIVPAAVFGVLAWRVSAGDTPLTGLWADVVASFAWMTFFCLLVVSAPRAVLAPENPAYRLTALKPVNTRIISRRLIVLATIAAIDFFLISVGDETTASNELASLYVFVAKGLVAVYIILLTAAALWEAEEPAAGDATVSHMIGQTGRGRRFWVWLRGLSRLTAIVAILAMAVGFISLGEYLIEGLIFTGLILGVLLLVRGLFRETVGLMTRSSFVVEQLGLRHGARSAVKFWLRAVLDLLMTLAAVAMILQIWGVPWPELERRIGDAFEDVSIGEVTISLVDVLVALAVFVVVLTISRWLQRALSESVLPELEIEPGLQNSVATGIGYIGIIVAAALGIAVMGIDLTSLALIFGALSVGIGFGLQNIVNNFVSGFVLLIERPIIVGDWVVIGPHEGFVKKINPRSTEIETWQRASVIVPNADFISQAVTNWTHTDKVGRIEVRVHVVRDCDTARVRDILLQIANEHPSVLVDPEPFVLFQDFNPSSLEFELRCYTNDVIWKLTIASDIRYEIDRKFRAEAIQIPFPRYVVRTERDAPAERADGPGNGMPEEILHAVPMARGRAAAGDGD